MGASAARSFVRSLTNDFGQLAEASREVRAHLDECGVAEELVHAVDLALEELVGNTIRHGCTPGHAHHIRLAVTVDTRAVRVTLRDDGLPFDPTRAPFPAPPTTVADTPIGGRGILMVRRLIDDMRYRREDGDNVLELTLPR